MKRLIPLSLCITTISALPYLGACEKAVIIRHQPVVYECEGTTTETYIHKTYTECAPTTCVPRPVRICEACEDSDVQTITTIGPTLGTTTLPLGPDGGTTVIVTKTPGGDITITTTGSESGATTLPIVSGDDATVIVTQVPDEDNTITTTGSVPGTTTLPLDSDDVSPTVIVTVTPDQITTATVTGDEPGTTTLPVDTAEPSESAETTVVVTVPTTTTDENPGPTPTESSASEPTEAESTTEPEPTRTPDANDDCPDLENGDFFVDGDGSLPPWYISDQVTADSSGVILTDNDAQSEAAFALIPSQAEFSQVYLNQQLPRCGDPPPEVTLRVRFRYQFTGASDGCMIGAAVNRSPDNIVDVVDDGASPGVWQVFEGEPTLVQLTYDSLFTLKLSCEADVANQPGILITDISVY